MTAGRAGGANAARAYASDFVRSVLVLYFFCPRAAVRAQRNSASVVAGHEARRKIRIAVRSARLLTGRVPPGRGIPRRFGRDAKGALRLRVSTRLSPGENASGRSAQNDGVWWMDGRVPSKRAGHDVSCPYKGRRKSRSLTPFANGANGFGMTRWGMDGAMPRIDAGHDISCPYGQKAKTPARHRRYEKQIPRRPKSGLARDDSEGNGRRGAKQACRARLIPQAR